jgi:hypothetical protein
MSDETGDRIYGLQVGYVINNADPERLGRVTVCIPGLIEPESAWAWPLGTGGGGADRRGRFEVPDKDAAVGVFFQDGDPQVPWYMGANWGIPAGTTTPEVPEPVRTIDAADASKVKALETERYLLVIDDRPTTRGLYLKDKVSEDVIEIDGVKQGIRLKGSYAVSIEADGIVNINGAQVLIKGRPVLPGTKPI